MYSVDWNNKIHSKKNADDVNLYTNSDLTKSFFYKNHYPKCSKIQKIVPSFVFFKKVIMINDPSYKDYQDTVKDNLKNIQFIIKSLRHDILGLDEIESYLMALFNCQKMYPDTLVLTDYFFDLIHNAISAYQTADNSETDQDIHSACVLLGRSIVVMNNILELYNKKHQIRARLNLYENSLRKLSENVRFLKTAEPEQRKIDDAFMPIMEFDRQIHDIAIAKLEVAEKQYNSFMFKMENVRCSIRNLINACQNDCEFVPTKELIDLIENHLEYAKLINSGVAAAFHDCKSFDIAKFGEDFTFLCDVLILNFTSKESV